MKRTLSFLLFVFLVLCLSEQKVLSQVTFNKTYDYLVDSDFNILPESNEYIKVMNAFYPPYSHLIFQKLDTNGDVIISKAYGNTSERFIIYSLIKSFDNNYVIGSYVNDLFLNKRFVFIAKLDTNGDTIWTKRISGPNGYNLNGNYLIETSDHGYLITGQIVDSAVTDGDILIIKTDSAGNFQWINSFGGPFFDSGYSSVQTSDGGYLSVGWTRSFGFGNNSNRDDIVVKWDSVGNYQWHQTFGSIYSEAAIAIISLQDGNYLVGSGRGFTSIPLTMGKLLKIDVNGSIIWQKYYGYGIDSYWKVKELPDFSLIGCGSKRVNGWDDGFLIKTDSTGNEIWRRLYRYGNEHCYFRDVKPTPDGGFICAGFVFEGASGGQDGWLVKLDSTGCLFNSCGEPTAIIEFPEASEFETSIYPNPVTDRAIVTIKGLTQELLDQRFKTELYDLSGKLITCPQSGQLILEDGIQFEFNKGSLNSGIYILKTFTASNDLLGIIKVVVK